MVGAGIDDLLIPVNILGPSKLARLAALLELARVTVSVDDRRLLPELAGAAGSRPLRVLVDCDTGLGRTGVSTPQAAAALARAVADTDRLLFEGFLTYPSLPAAAPFFTEALSLVADLGLETAVVSAGGTPEMWRAGERVPPRDRVSRGNLRVP